MSLRIFVPRDTSAIACGADAVAAKINSEAVDRGVDVVVVRNGSRGLCWLEPLVEVDMGEGRYGFGPIEVDDVAGLFECGFARDGGHPKAVGLVEEIDWLKNQNRQCFSRNGITDPLSLDDYRALGGWRGLENALLMAPDEIVHSITESGLRGRGGAAFPCGIKWKTVLDQSAEQKYIVCNADEGDSGTFSDRMVMEGDPYRLIEGMLIAGIAVGADKGYIYLRSEYPLAERILFEAIKRARHGGWIGNNIQGSGRDFDIELRLGAGAYICGEETSLLESLEGRRGEVRFKPPLPAIEGLFGKPTVINNVISLASVPDILIHGADWYRGMGMGRSRGTLPIQLTGNIRRGGLIELAFGVSLRELLEDYGGGSASGRPIRAVQVGGPLGAYLPESQFDTPIDYEAFIAIDAMLGHGGIVVFDDSVDMAEQARFAMGFCAIESCGKCTPCRIGSTRGVEVIDHIRGGVDADANKVLLKSLCETMLHGSLCALGGMTPLPVLSALKHFPEDFEIRRPKVS
ncbi:MAG TPA: NADH-quinone oxidoreductase subunit NuoF [Dokdonella sp.]|uniref:formate dehydrogenase beta subunit n=1 Tax=Dokdonella sp. TaxID=2291710 RepID=UPI002D7FDBCE|nr:NADH-quinone oxidoreductase subunit NuoF [Dokdonella sp.]HET9034378.1 NADH-quinone oxidoreductase subunit NuoF [Dokdonella sp.]